MKLAGIPASPGIVIGPIFVYTPPKPEITQASIAAEQAPAEWRRLEVALGQARDQITEIRDNTARRLSVDEAAIFDAHLLILEDEELLKAMRERIFERHENAETASWEAMKAFRDLLLEIDDEYLRARSADLHDIAGRVLSCLQGNHENAFSALNAPSVIVARDLMPSDTAGLDLALVLGLVTEEGGRTSHTAIIARQLNLPAVVGARGLLEAIQQSATEPVGSIMVAIDGAEGTVDVAPDDATVTYYETQQRAFSEYQRQLANLATLPCVTRDGHTIELLANAGTLQTATEAAKRGAEGIGLFRTEFLFLERNSAPTEDEQTEVYLTAAQSFPRGYVIVRTLDIGGDKNVPYLRQEPEANPFLGLRGLRLCLAPHFIPVFKTQLRALLRAAVRGANLRIMFPMVNDVGEVRQARAMLRQAAEELEGEGIAAISALERLPVGAMIETPTAAYTTDLLAAECDFFSIGTNDLTQYMLAVDRLNTAVAPLYDSFAPGVLRALYAAVSGAHNKGRKIGMWGEMAGDPRATPLLLGIGLDEFSMSAQALPEVKHIVRLCSQTEARNIVAKAYSLSTATEVAQMLKATIEELRTLNAAPI
ncbi:MAG TPA: phosphoenolpyruvate--protein phosphotransferase [Ktedonobacterales bacterium]|nr:phosphoenolpyruvate--protein phosphotransferase [Ktedonobacterales bacterium]